MSKQGKLIAVRWYNSTIDAAGEYLTRNYQDAVTHAIACLRQGSEVEVSDAMTGARLSSPERPSIAVFAALREIAKGTVRVRPGEELPLPEGVSYGAVLSAMAQGLASWFSPSGYTRNVCLTDAGRALIPDEAE